MVKIAVHVLKFHTDFEIHSGFAKTCDVDDFQFSRTDFKKTGRFIFRTDLEFHSEFAQKYDLRTIKKNKQIHL